MVILEVSGGWFTFVSYKNGMVEKNKSSLLLCISIQANFSQKMLSYSALLVVSCAVVMLMDNGVGAQNTYHYRNAMPASHLRQMQSNPFVNRNIYKVNTIKPVAANNNWGWPTAVQQQNRWKVNFDNSIEDNSVESIESSFQRRPSIPRTQRHSITANSNPHNMQRAWSRPAAVPVRQQQPIRWNKNFHDSDEDHSVESRESRRW